MNLIINNPYRIAGILANSSEKDILKQKSKIKRFSEVGKEINSEYDFSFFNSLQRTNSIIEKAFSDIEQNQNKVNHSLFWFINLNPVDNTAIQHLVSGNKEKAIEIWYKLTNEKEVTSNNFSAFNNIGTLYLLEDSKEEIKNGISAKIKLIESESFKDFVQCIADETFSIDKNKQIEIFIDELLLQFKNKFSTTETLDLFINCSVTTKKYLSKKYTIEPIHKIETHIEQTQNKRNKNKINAYRFGIDLHQNTKNELILLKSILGKGNLQYKMIADYLAKELLQCSIDYFNESQEQNKNTDYLEEAMKLAKIAQTIAINEATINKVRENINKLEGMKDQELNQAISVLKSIKQAYDHACAKIDVEVFELKMNLSYNQTINYSKIEEMKQKALDWNKVVELVKEAIPQKNIEKIKTINNPELIKEYKNLIDFLLPKLSFFQVNQVKYLCYWKTDNTVSNVELTVKSLPPWAKWIVGIALFLIVVSLIWGEDGLGVVFSISAFLGVMLILGWLQSLQK